MRPIVSLLFLASAATAAPASAQMLVIGEPAAVACYENALARRSDREALEDCNAALELPTQLRVNRAASYVNRGVILMHRGRSEDALADYDRAEAIGLPEPTGVALNRSSAFIRLGRMQEALAQTDIIIEADDRHLAEAWFNRGVALESLGETTAAYNAYSRALDERPGWRLAEIELERFTVRSGS